MRRHGVDEARWGNILGGETAIWSEQTSEGDVLSKVKCRALSSSLLCIFTRWSRELPPTERGCGWGT